MPGLSAGFHCWPRNLSAGSQCRCPYMGSRFLGSGTSTGSAAGWGVGPPTGSVLVVAACTHAGQIAVCWRFASDGWSLLRFTMFLRLAIEQIDAWQVAVSIARRAESVDT
jgi:hypothetical protein